VHARWRRPDARRENSRPEQPVRTRVASRARCVWHRFAWRCLVRSRPRACSAGSRGSPSFVAPAPRTASDRLRVLWRGHPRGADSVTSERLWRGDCAGAMGSRQVSNDRLRQRSKHSNAFAGSANLVSVDVADGKTEAPPLSPLLMRHRSRLHARLAHSESDGAGGGRNGPRGRV
jgi:hypothetical protein